MRSFACALLLSLPITLAGQQPAPASIPPPAAAPALLSTPGPLYTTPQPALHTPIKLIAYGDQRFTDPSNTTATNPAARRLLVEKILSEHPDAVVMSGDVPYRGNVLADYDVFRSETASWRAAGLRIYPALGNHEFARCEPEVCLENWWNAFPEMPQLRNRRWYAAQLGAQIYILSIDSDTSLLPGSPQRAWIEQQIAALPASIRFVVITMHHPPVADVQTTLHVDHNPRPNEISLRDYLAAIAPRSRARFIVVAGHIHNYERFEENGVLYFVSGGGAAQPYEVDRTPSDKYQDKDFPNYHYLRFTLDVNTLKGEMVRLADPAAVNPVWQVRDSFTIKSK
jgi:hypothetical protein